MEKWQEERIKFYENSKELEYIKNFFNVEKGVRCIVGHERNMEALRRIPSYRLYKGKDSCGMTIPDHLTGKYNSLKNYWILHVLVFIYDKNVLEWHPQSENKTMFINNVIGIEPVFDLDTPTGLNGVREDIVGYIDEMNDAIYKIRKALEKVGEDKIFIDMSGNGAYVRMEKFYGTFEEVNDFKDNFVNIIDALKEGELGDENQVHIDNKKCPWNDYFKIPYSFHKEMNRVMIPDVEEINLDIIKKSEELYVKAHGK